MIDKLDVSPSIIATIMIWLNHTVKNFGALDASGNGTDWNRDSFDQRAQPYILIVLAKRMCREHATRVIKYTSRSETYHTRAGTRNPATSIDLHCIFPANFSKK